jgi:PHD/YefM family antitoxin component YafN of YafNO toxin-antitoxin module
MSELASGDAHEVIHLGGETAVVVPLAEYRRLRHDAHRAQLIELSDEEEAAGVAAFRAQQAAGPIVTVPQAEVRRRFGLAEQ